MGGLHAAAVVVPGCVHQAWIQPGHACLPQVGSGCVVVDPTAAAAGYQLASVHLHRPIWQLLRGIAGSSEEVGCWCASTPSAPELAADAAPSVSWGCEEGWFCSITSLSISMGDPSRVPDRRASSSSAAAVASSWCPRPCTASFTSVGTCTPAELRGVAKEPSSEAHLED